MNREQWHHEGLGLREELDAYDWQYRMKICSKCIGTQQQKDRNCLAFKVDELPTKIIQDKEIPETHCDHMNKARSRKFRSKIKSFMNLGMGSMYGKQVGK